MNNLDNKDSRHFYKNLPLVKESFTYIFDHPDLLHSIPDDWMVVVTDIKGSTAANADHRYRDINTISTRSLMIGLNIARDQGIEVPYVYGGDGATLVVPQILCDSLIDALSHYRAVVVADQDLDLRVGAISVSAVRQAGFKMQVAKMAIGQHTQEAVFTDASLQYAEYMIKNNAAYQQEPLDHPHPRYDFSGVVPTWEILYEPDNDEYGLALIIAASDNHSHFATYARVLTLIEDYFGDMEKRHPYVQNARGRQLATDAMKFDGTLKTILAADRPVIDEFLSVLSRLEKENILQYGYVVTDAAIVTAVIAENTHSKIALVDLADGGYIEAAKMIKAKKD